MRSRSELHMVTWDHAGCAVIVRDVKHVLIWDAIAVLVGFRRSF